MNNRKNFSHRVIVRAPSLLPMLYTPRELEWELDVPACTLRDWTKMGMPSQKDEQGHIWIHGVAFACWVERIRNSQVNVRLARDEAYCLHCKKPVKLSKPQKRQMNQGKLSLTQGLCPTCGSTIHRGGCSDQSG